MALIYILRISEDKGKTWHIANVLKGVSLDYSKDCITKRIGHSTNAIGEVYKAKDEDVTYMKRINKGATYRELIEEVITWKAKKYETIVWVPERKMYRLGSGKYATI